MKLSASYNVGGASASPILRGPVLHRRATLAFALGASLLLAACGENDTAAGAGGVSVGEARSLDEAAQLLDSQRLSDAVLDGDTDDSSAQD